MQKKIPVVAEQGLMMANKILKLSSLLLLGMVILAKLGFANNLTINNFEVSNIDIVNKRIAYTCDISWNNGWKTTINNDAVWAFMKYSLDGGQTWKHASMNGSGKNPLGFVVPNNYEIIVPSDEKGFFLQRSSFGTGDTVVTGIKFIWDYAQDGLTDEQAKAANTINRIFGVEMVYVPEGSFYLGDGASSSEYKFQKGSADTNPWYLTSEDAITTTNAAADGYYYQSSGASGESATGSVFVIPTSFPKGVKAFYQMKYELTEGQWISFFNALTPAEKINRDITSANLGGKNSDSIVDRNTIAWDVSKPNTMATTLRPDRPVSYLSWMDLLAYADWAGLRPMTELEFEKSSRGKDIAPVADEFAWGKNTYNAADPSGIYPDAAEDGTEQIFDGNANLNRNNGAWSSGDGRVGGNAQGQKGPLRAGIFAEASTNRTTSGAAYYGAMEMSGNLYEMVVTVGKTQGRQYLGTHGDGNLSNVAGYEGNATNNDWPGIDVTDAARGVTTTIGSGYRGGDFQSPNIRHFQLSNRTFAVKDPDSEGFYSRYDARFGVYGGGRLVRTAP
ncbi:MAG: SUMF1/EgtB/PvdO family nonheme iron enzyme [Candidatus Omnitrophica bacterium]|nr:SUMF1/EgtB/PvdO family nonheme iron enzyme [Candidatus Omnitrophota bacterium]